MSERAEGGTSGVLSVVAWVLLFAGLGILVYELVRGEGFSLVGAGVAAVGGVTAWSLRGVAEAEGPGQERP